MFSGKVLALEFTLHEQALLVVAYSVGVGSACRGEAFVRSPGGKSSAARMQIAPDEMTRLADLKSTMKTSLHEAGFEAGEVDSENYRSAGSPP